MKAAFCIGNGRFEIRDVETPALREGEALVRVKACGICGSDKHAFRLPQPSEHIPGHELSGVVEKVVSAEGVGVGDEVVVDPVIPCGQCKYCVAERTSLCAQRKGTIGYGVGGGFAEYVSVPVRCLCQKPHNIDFAEASMTEPLGVAVNGANLKDVTALDCIVFGAGAIGTMLAQVLKLRGADRVYIVDIAQSHLEVARGLGDFITIKADEPDAWNVLKAADVRVAYDVVGRSRAVLDKAIEVVRPRGALVLIGVQEDGLLDMASIERKRLSLIHSQGVSVAEMREALRLLETGQVNVRPLITGRFPLERIEEAFQASLTGIKVVVEPS